MQTHTYTTHTLTVQCPLCRQTMKTASKNVLKSVKKCVYCGRSFRIHSPSNSRIAQAIPPASIKSEFKR